MVRLLSPSFSCVFALAACDQISLPELPTESTTARSWPHENWQVSSPEREGLDAQAIVQLDEEFRSGEHGYVDSMLIVRNGRIAFEAYYENDYQAINADLVTGESGPWNYYDVSWHPFHKGSDLHTMQSTTKSFMSALVGIEDYYWKDAPEGFKDVAGGLYLKSRDPARFALLYGREGEWDGRQIVPAEWVANSAQPHVENAYPEDPDSNVGYGYRWWIYKDGSDGEPVMYGSWGWGGQCALIVAELDLIGVFTGWNIYDGMDHKHAYRLFYDRVVIPAARNRVRR